MADAPLSRVVDDLIEKMKGPLGLDRWQIRVVVGPGDDTAACNAMPEYRIATISVDPDKLDTGDELDEIIAHELTHCPLWPLAAAADDLRIAVSEMLPEEQRPAMVRYLAEQVRLAEERAATDIGRAFVTLLRTAWKLEAELAASRAEVRQLRKAAALP